MKNLQIYNIAVEMIIRYALFNIEQIFFFDRFCSFSLNFQTTHAMADFVDAKLKQPGLIYIIQEGTSNYFKVGASENENTVKLRVLNLQSGNWRKLTLIQTKSVSNMKLAEDEAHNSLQQVHVQAGGGQEWFNSSFQTIADAVNAAAGKYPPN